jgi:excisionase family DNA binding protein
MSAYEEHPNAGVGLMALPFLKVTEAAELARVSRRHIQRLIERGEIEAGACRAGRPTVADQDRDRVVSALAVFARNR